MGAEADLGLCKGIGGRPRRGRGRGGWGGLRGPCGGGGEVTNCDRQDPWGFGECIDGSDVCAPAPSAVVGREERVLSSVEPNDRQRGSKAFDIQSP